MPASQTPASPVSLKEVFWAALLSLLLGSAFVGPAMWDAERVFFPSDTATVQGPWDHPGEVANPQLSDAAVTFYPHYRRLSESWRRAEVPLWNPDIYVGVPLLANAQWGALDPQVLALVLLEHLGGARLLDRGLAWLAALRIAIACLGTYWLARRLALRPLSAALAGVSFALSGSLALWLGFSLAHVTPALPWIFLGIEGLRDAARVDRSFSLTAIAMALGIYGGHPEVAFFVGLSAGVWSLFLWSESRRAAVLALSALACGVLLAAPVLLPFVEYLQNSGALLAHRMAPSSRGVPDLLSLGALILLLGLLHQLRARLKSSGDSGSLEGLVVPVLSIGLACFGWLWLVSGRGVQFDLGFAPPWDLEGSSVRIASVALWLVIVGQFDGLFARGPWRKLSILTGVSFLLAHGIPGVVDLWSWIPLVGLAAPQRAASVAVLGLALLAGASLGRRSRGALLAGAVVMGVLISVGHLRSRVPVLDPQFAGLDELESFVELGASPSASSSAGVANLRGTLGGDLEVEALRVGFERLGAGGELLSESGIQRWARLATSGVPGTRAFDFGDLELRALGPGNWRVRLDFMAQGQVVAQRRVDLVRQAAAPSWTLDQLLLWMVALGLALWLRERSMPWLVGAASANAWLPLVGWNPTLEREGHFGPTKTEGVLERHFTGERFFSDPGIYPGSTALLTSAATIDGYDAMDVASFDGYRAFALKPGMNPLLDWNLHGAALDSPAFRLFGVRAFLTREARDEPAWELVAGPEGAPEFAEVFVYEDREAMPREFCVGQVASRDAVLADLDAFDPAQAAFLESERTFELESPFNACEVRCTRREPGRLDFEVELDGEGLFISTEQHFPGWKLEVDGESRDILRVNSIFRGAYLKAGTHRLEFEYDPASWWWGRALGAFGSVVLLLGGFFAGRIGRPRDF